MRLKTLLVGVALAVCIGIVVAPNTFAQNLLTNGSFETGTFSGWTTGGNFEDTFVENGAFSYYSGAQDGTYWAALGPVSTDGTLSQTFATTAGAQYTFSFWFASNGDNPSDFSASWDGTALLSLTNPDTGVSWTQYTYTATGTGHDTISFSFADNPAYMALDNVSVTQNTEGGTVPEPSSLLLLGTGIVGLGGMIRRKLHQ
jgi:hypothetical protein